MIKETQKKLDLIINKNINNFNDTVSGVEQLIYRELELAIKDLDLNDGNLSNTVKNIKSIGKIKKIIERTILKDKNYLKSIKDFTKAYSLISDLQNEYFDKTIKDFKIPKVVEAIQQQSIISTVEALTESGIGANISKPITDLLKNNITSGGSYNDLLKQLRINVLTNDKGLGVLMKYTKQITTDSLNQYNAQYNTTLTDSLGLDVGSNLDTTRCFCEKLTNKRYIHVSELPNIINTSLGCEKNPKTKLWYGAIDGTNEYNFKVNRGGYSCGHQLYGVSEALVPNDLVEQFKNK
jgi:hypothetical protein